MPRKPLRQDQRRVYRTLTLAPYVLMILEQLSEEGDTTIGRLIDQIVIATASGQIYPMDVERHRGNVADYGRAGFSTRT